MIGEYTAIPGKLTTVFARTSPPKLLIIMADITGTQPLYNTDCVLELQ